MTDLADLLCTKPELARFQPLTDTLKGFTTADLAWLTAEEFLDGLSDGLDGKRKVLLKVLVATGLAPYFKKSPSPPPSLPEPEAEPDELWRGFDQDRIVLRSQVLPSSFGAGFAGVTALNLPTRIEAALKYGLNTIRVFDVSNCNLMDNDLQHIAATVNKVKPRLQEATVDLSFNRFNDLLPFIRPWLQDQGIKYVVVDGNPFATISHVDDFHSLPRQAFQRLVFVPESMLKGGGWHVMVPVSSTADVHATHINYYTGKKRRQ